MPAGSAVTRLICSQANLFRNVRPAKGANGPEPSSACMRHWVWWLVQSKLSRHCKGWPGNIMPLRSAAADRGSVEGCREPHDDRFGGPCFGAEPAAGPQAARAIANRRCGRHPAQGARPALEQSHQRRRSGLCGGDRYSRELTANLCTILLPIIGLPSRRMP
jgi:hypothetical protein